MRFTKLIAASALLLACGGGGDGGGKGAVTPAGPKTASGGAVTKAAEDSFNVALEAFAAHDNAADWSDAVCADVAKKFEAAVSNQKSGKFPEATFNAGLSYQRCSNDKEAQAHFRQSLADDSKFHNARVQLALYQFKADGNVDAAIGELQKAVLDAQFQNVSALVNLAMFQQLRDGATGGDGCKDDMECSKKNLQRALAIDDGYMPAFNQLALYYFKQAKKRAGYVKVGKKGREIATNAAFKKRADQQQLELAALVCSQAIRKNAKYAPIHNTAGLIQNELGQVNGAVQEFKAAAALDPRFFEAQMNYAFVNLSFRGFEAAQGALEKAIAMQPNDYEAHLGLALAYRGQISDVNFDAMVKKTHDELDKAKQIDPNRADSYYNEGILVNEFEVKNAAVGETDKDKIKNKTIAAYKKAQTILEQFVGKASGKPEYDGAVKRTNERIQDIKDMIKFFEEPDLAPEPNTQPPPPSSTEGAPANAGQAGANPKPAPGGDKPVDKPAEKK
jgi:tetratricopeptide (TPR) repeat protein